MQQLFKTFIFLLLYTNAFTQTKISLTSSSITINSKAILKSMTSPKLIQVLGEPDRKHINGGIFWTYDKLGLVFIFSNDKLSGFEICYPGCFEFDHTPENKFSGKFLISGYDVVPKTTLQSLKKIPGLAVDKVKYYLNCGCDTKIGNFNISFVYDEDCFVIKQVNFLLNK